MPSNLALETACGQSNVIIQNGVPGPAGKLLL